MGAPKKYSAKRLEAAVAEYFDAISVQEEIFAMEPVFVEDKCGDTVPAMDAFGHQKLRRVPVIAANGKQAVRLRWIVQPKITDLCNHLGISPTTWEKYCQDEQFVKTTTHARGYVESYWLDQAETKHGSRGAKFVLQNMGWKEKKEIGFDKETAESMKEYAAHMTMAEKQAELAKMALEFAETVKEEK